MNKRAISLTFSLLAVSVMAHASPSDQALSQQRAAYEKKQAALTRAADFIARGHQAKERDLLSSQVKTDSAEQTMTSDSDNADTTPTQSGSLYATY